MIHRTLLGALERFFTILIEHCEGNLPVWLSPIEVMVLPVSDKQILYADTIHERLQANGLRSDIDSNASTIGYKVREAEVQKIPYIAICGNREMKLRKISVRKHEVGNISLLTIKELTEKIKSEYPR
jgi:threonyl-tRNA synthetase